ncbi:methyltransferase domain-containing protein [Candidatus Shapirobacteria bacterium]|nr:methyltransferase domain-containing protein [Candidatus Shapirobacteria bacterium]
MPEANSDQDGWSRFHKGTPLTQLSAVALAEKFDGGGNTCHLTRFGWEINVQLLVEDVIQKEKDKSWRILCVGCSTGEEPYELAMRMLNAGCASFSIDAIDVSEQVIKAAQKGEYSGVILRAKDFLEEMATKGFVEVTQELGGSASAKIAQAVRERVNFSTSNIVDVQLPPGSYDVVICNNVLQYYSRAERDYLVARMAETLKDKGLFLTEHTHTIPSGAAPEQEKFWIDFINWQGDLSKFGLSIITENGWWRFNGYRYDAARDEFRKPDLTPRPSKNYPTRRAKILDKHEAGDRGGVPYEELPILSVRDLPPQCGFSTEDREWPEKSRKLFLQCLVEAIQNLDWAGVSLYTPEHRTRKEKNLPRARYMDRHSLFALQDYSREDLLSVADKLARRCLSFPTPMAEVDIVARALEIMGNHYPNLMMFRGCTYSREEGFEGYDFAPGDLPMALDYALRSHEGARRRPAIAMIKFSNVILEYSRGAISILTEGNWWRRSLEIHMTPEVRRGISLVRRVPNNDKQAIEAIKKAYNERAIKL